MKIDYHKWWSPSLRQDMELKSYGYYGKPMLVFPAQGSRFYEFEDRGMTAACAELIESGRIKVYTVDSVDNQSWANYGIAPQTEHADIRIMTVILPMKLFHLFARIVEIQVINLSRLESAWVAIIQPTPFFATLRSSIRSLP